MKQLQDFRTWFAIAGMLGIVMVLLDVQGKAWLLLTIVILTGIAVRIKYGADVLSGRLTEDV